MGHLRTGVYHSETTQTVKGGRSSGDESGLAARPEQESSRALTSLSRALKLLIKLREASKPMGLSELSRVLNLHKATAYRLLVTLEGFQFVERSVDKKYRIGAGAFFVGAGFVSGGRGERLDELLKQLARESRHTVTMSVLDEASVLFTNRADGESRVRVAVEVGSRVPAYASASGKALLAGLTDEAIRARFEGSVFKRWTPRTIRSVTELLVDVGKVRRCGVAFNDEESTAGLCALSAPVRDSNGKHVAALTVAYPAGSLTGRERGRLGKKVTEAAREIARFAVDY